LNVGSIALKRDDATALVSPDYVVFKCCENDLDPQFLDFYRRTDAWRASIARSGQGSVRVRYYFHHIAAFPIGLPPLREQRAIARVLRTVQEAKEACARVIAATRQLKHSLLAHLFTYGPVPFDQADKVRLKETEIGQIPEHWSIDRLDIHWDSMLGKMASPKARAGKSPRPYLRNANVQWGRIDLGDLSEMDFDDKDYDRYGLRSGDVLICEGGEVARTAIWKGELEQCYYQKAIHRLRSQSGKMTPEFLLHHMMHAFLIRKTYGEVGTITTIAHLPGIKLKALPLPVPPVEEQHEIAAQLSAVDAKLAAEESRRDALASLFNSLLHNLMTGRVRLSEFARGL
jgi:type I restriction enzyme S subunit